jgi:hypothetical protein
LGRATRKSLELTDVDTDRKAANADLSIKLSENNLTVHRLQYPDVRAAIFGEHVADEVSNVAVRLKSQQIVLKQGGEEAFMARQDGYELRRRERNVEKKTHAIGVATFSKLLPERDKVIIMNPNQVTRQDNLGEFVSKMLVNSQISTQITPRELSKVDAVMQNGP